MGRKASNPETVQRRRVLMVELKYPMEGVPPVTFFSSKKAIFEYFGNRALGITYGTANTRNWRETPYENARCRIFDGYILTQSSPELIAKREAEGREPIPVKHTPIFDKE